jgi:hypothetical protein
MPMKLSVFLSVLIAGILVSGCASKHPKPATSAPGATQTIVTPDASLAARVVSYNEVGRFVVLNFPVGQLPKADRTFFLYRNGLKVGEIKIDTWQLDNLTVAYIVTGDAQVGDEVRNQ